MKPVKNERTTYFDVGDTINSTYSVTPNRGFIVTKIVPCHYISDPCKGCNSGGMRYEVKRFHKRTGRHTIHFCGSHSAINPELVSWNPGTRETIRCL